MPDEPLITGLDEMQAEIARLIEALANFPPIAAGEIGQAMDRTLMLLQGEASDYPAEPPDSTYRRTGTLGRLWTSAAREVKVGGSGAFVWGRIGNATPYGPYVQDPDRQAAVHRDRWRTTDQIVADNEAGIAMILEEAGGRAVTEIVREAGM